MAIVSNLRAMLPTYLVVSTPNFAPSSGKYPTYSLIEGNFMVPESPTPEDATESLDYLLMGSVMATVPIRNTNSKWYLPPRFYPLNIFPK